MFASIFSQPEGSSFERRKKQGEQHGWVAVPDGMLQFTPCDAEVSSPGASPKWRNRFQLIHSRECTDNKLIPEKRSSSVPSSPCNDTYAPPMFSLCVRSFWFHLGCLCARKWEVSKVETVYCLPIPTHPPRVCCSSRRAMPRFPAPVPVRMYRQKIDSWKNTQFSSDPPM